MFRGIKHLKKSGTRTFRKFGSGSEFRTMKGKDFATLVAVGIGPAHNKQPGVLSHLTRMYIVCLYSVKYPGHTSHTGIVPIPLSHGIAQAFQRSYLCCRNQCCGAGAGGIEKFQHEKFCIFLVFFANAMCYMFVIGLFYFGFE